ncbi:MAG TPA: TetR family transcriptional regulator, partial [Caulobacteraceae bacterium]|nr:TetR family transcriptional regulator [Caulobacteraceae bacterium]
MRNTGMNEAASERTASSATRGRLIAAAKRLFAARGFEAVTVRDILTEAGEKNGASISYYFGSREGLIFEITSELFSFLDGRWSAGLAELDRLGRPATVRELITVAVKTSTELDVEGEEPTASRLSEALSHQRHQTIQQVMKAQKLTAWDRMLARISHELPHIPAPIMRQRLIFLTRYLSSVFALYESARVSGSERQRATLGSSYDLGNVIDTAVGLV